MTKITYKETITKAKTVQKNMKEYKTGVSSTWAYYFAKQVVSPKKDVTKITIKDAPNPKGNSISQGIKKANYLDICKRLVTWVEKHKTMPNYVTYAKYQLTPHLLTEFLSRVLIYYDKNGKWGTISINSKCFTKPTETGNVVYDYVCKKYGKTFKTMDEVLNYVANHFKYEYYYDDQKSNKQVTDSKAGNCTDLLQWLWNMCKAMGYDCKCIHVKCRSSGDGHVFGKFKHKKHTENTWVTRDIACCAKNGSIKCVWCGDGYVQATNPSWFMNNLNR